MGKDCKCWCPGSGPGDPVRNCDGTEREGMYDCVVCDLFGSYLVVNNLVVNDSVVDNFVLWRRGRYV